MARRQAVDLAAYVTSLGENRDVPIELSSPTDEALIEQGEVYFENLGCIACHRFTPPQQEDPSERISLWLVSKKFFPGALKQFLCDPRQHDPFSRMPDFHLSEQEVTALAAYLLAQGTGSLDDFTESGSVARGRELFTKVGCVSCHVGDGKDTPQPPARRVWKGTNLMTGCLDPDGASGGGVPNYDLTHRENEAIRAFLGTDMQSLGRTVHREFVTRQMAHLRCNACHDHETPAKLPRLLAEEGSQGLPVESVPKLTWAGEKLRAEWTKRLFNGSLAYRTRAHLRVRMPAFPARAEGLSKGLSAQHGFTLDENVAPIYDEQMGQRGAQIAAIVNGLACNRCHPLGEIPSPAPREMLSTDLARAAERLRYNYYLRWMYDPLRVDPATRMIKFSPDGKRTPLTEFYNGDARMQFVALWHYLNLLNQQQRVIDRQSGGKTTKTAPVPTPLN